jgi:hypothetical protein
MSFNLSNYLSSRISSSTHQAFRRELDKHFGSRIAAYNKEEIDRILRKYETVLSEISSEFPELSGQIDSFIDAFSRVDNPSPMLGEVSESVEEDSQQDEDSDEDASSEQDSDEAAAEAITTEIDYLRKLKEEAQKEFQRSDISEIELDKPQNGSWNARQVVHHVADSEARSYARLRRLIAEPGTQIQSYDEAGWGENETLGYKVLPVENSLAVFRAVRS